jgi:hypothetical protein
MSNHYTSIEKQTASKDNLTRHLKMHESKKQAQTPMQAQKVQNALYKRQFNLDVSMYLNWLT